MKGGAWGKSAPPPACSPPSAAEKPNGEYDNFFRLCVLVHETSAKALRKLIKQQYLRVKQKSWIKGTSGKALHEELVQVKETVRGIQTYSAQLSLLKEGDIDAFDVTLCMLLLKNTCLKPDEETFSKLTMLGDSRNKLCHPKDGCNVSETAFQQVWQNVSSSLLNLKLVDQGELDEVRSLTTFSEDRKEELLALQRQHDDLVPFLEKMFESVLDKLSHKESVASFNGKPCANKLKLLIRSVKKPEPVEEILWEPTHIFGLEQEGDNTRLNSHFQHDKHVQKRQITFHLDPGTKLYKATPHGWKDDDGGEDIGTWLRLEPANESLKRVQVSQGDIFTIGDNIGNANTLYRSCFKVVKMVGETSLNPQLEREPIYKIMEEKRKEVSSRSTNWPKKYFVKIKDKLSDERHWILKAINQPNQPQIFFRMHSEQEVWVKEGMFFRFGAESSIEVVQADGAPSEDGISTSEKDCGEPSANIATISLEDD